MGLPILPLLALASVLAGADAWLPGADNCPTTCGSTSPTTAFIDRTTADLAQDNVASVDTCIAVCGGFAFYYYDPSSLLKTCKCYSVCSNVAFTGPSAAFFGSVLACSSAPFRSPTCPTRCTGNRTSHFGFFYTGSSHYRFFPGVLNVQTCATKCATVGAKFYQLAAGPPANGVNAGDCDCFGSCPGTFLNFAPQVYTQGQVCSCVTCPPPTPQPGLSTSCTQRGTKYDCRLCGTNNPPVSQVQLAPVPSNLTREGGFSPLGTVLAPVLPNCCVNFNFKTTDASVALQVFDSPLENSTLVIQPPFIQGSPVSITCPTRNIFQSGIRVVFEHICKVTNTGSRTVRNVLLACQWWYPISFKGGLNPDCTITTYIAPGKSTTVSYQTYGYRRATYIAVAGFS